MRYEDEISYRARRDDVLARRRMRRISWRERGREGEREREIESLYLVNKVEDGTTMRSVRFDRDESFLAFFAQVMTILFSEKICFPGITS